MRKILSLSIEILFILVIFGSLVPSQVNAASLSNLKDIITTSRPSASSPLTSNAAAGSGAISIANNGSRYLASDSASIIRNAGNVLTNVGLNVASQSANLQTVYLGSVTGTFAGAGADVLIVPIVSRHTVSFNVVNTVPSGGTIVVRFPGSSSNIASPSATTFDFNNLANGNISSSPAGACNSISISAPQIICTSNTAITAGSSVTITIGSTSPTLINPTKSAAAGTADTWKIFVTTTDGVNDLDTGSARIATIESVEVQATVEPTITFTIAGMPNNTNINSDGTYGLGSCGAIVTNSGIDASPTSVNLGILSNGYISASGQQLTVSTNAASGYVITATSSGQLRNPSSGQIIVDANGGTGLTGNDTPAPAAIVTGTPAFGIHPCGARSSINTDQWVNNGIITTARFSNPWNTGTNSFYNTLASYSGGPVTQDKTNVVYAATVSGTTPAGVYITALTYVATATF